MDAGLPASVNCENGGAVPLLMVAQKYKHERAANPRCYNVLSQGIYGLLIYRLRTCIVPLDFVGVLTDLL